MKKENYNIYLYNRYEPDHKKKYQKIAIIKSKGLAFIVYLISFIWIVYQCEKVLN